MGRVTDLILVGDEAWTPEEWGAEQKRRAQRNAYSRRYIKRPDVRAKKTAYMREWRKRNLTKVREQYRQWGFRKRGVPGFLVGSLHDLACTGPTRDRGCVCKKIKCYDRPREKAA